MMRCDKSSSSVAVWASFETGEPLAGAGTAVMLRRWLTCLTLVIAWILVASIGHGSQVRFQEVSPGSWKLLKDGKPFVIRGAGGTVQLDLLKAHGGNALRTWGIEDWEKVVDGMRVIDRCAELGIGLVAGIHIAHERHGFDYRDPVQTAKQREMVRGIIRKYKDHPAILLWGLGNEMEGPETDGNVPHVWKEMNILASIVKEEDPHHPVMSVIAGTSPVRVQSVIKHYPNLDILGVNAYAEAAGAATAVRNAGWRKPFVLGEFGPPGYWQVQRTPWGAAIEPSSREKAASYYAMQKLVEEECGEFCLGSFCFYWGQKQETTSTWFGMFLKTGEKLPPVDAMCRAWTDMWPSNRCPRIGKIRTDLREAVVEPGRLSVVRVDVSDPEGDDLQIEWVVHEESRDIRVGGDRELEPPSIPESIVHTEGTQAVIRAPAKSGPYRLFVIVRDGQGAACVENVCFRVE